MEQRTLQDTQFSLAFVTTQFNMNKLFRKFRSLNRLYAYINGYFWTRCPICGIMFGGHEVGDAAVMTSPSYGKCACWKHTKNETIRLYIK